MLPIAWITLRRITEKSILVQVGVLVLVLMYIGLGLDSVVFMNSASSEGSGLNVGWLFLSIFTIFWSTLEIPREIDRKEVHVYLAKPISRARYLLGKYLGMTGMVLAVEAVLMAIFSLCLITRGMHPSAGFFCGLGRLGLFLALLNAICVTASMLLSEVRAMVTVLIVLAAGAMVVAIAVLAWSSYNPLPAAVLAASYHLLPDLFHFEWEPAAGELLSYLGWLSLYTAGWCAICLLIARTIFDRMDLP